MFQNAGIMTLALHLVLVAVFFVFFLSSPRKRVGEEALGICLSEVISDQNDQSRWKKNKKKYHLYELRISCHTETVTQIQPSDQIG